MKKLYFLFAACVATIHLWGQSSDTRPWAAAAVPAHCPVADAGPDVTLNALSTIIGPATVVPGATYSWSPTFGLSDPNVPNPVVTPPLVISGPFTYTLTMSSTRSSVNLVSNGDFSQGNTAFDTQYTYITPGTHGYPDQYTITPTPRVMNPQWCEAYTGGNPNNMMVIDGSLEGPDRFFWAQHVPVEPNTDYIFSFETMSVWSTTPAILGANINGVNIIQHALGGAYGWLFPKVTWNSGSSTTASIVLYSFSKVGTGNDFAVDNIKLTAVCPATTDEVVIYKKPLLPKPPCRPPLCPPGTTAAADADGEASVYPNPAQHVVNVLLDEASGTAVRIEIRDRYGKVVRSVDTPEHGSSLQVDVQDLHNGIYTISVRSGSGVTTKRFAIEH